MPSLTEARARDERYAPSYLPVVVIIGGTSGIGQAMAEAFARYTNGNAHIIICGRNRAAGEAILATFPKPPVTGPGGPLHEFVQCDVSLMKNVESTVEDLLARLPKINFLIHSAGFLSMKGREETEEGIDRKLACHYYSRFKFFYELMPLLRHARDAGEDAKVMTVQAAGWGKPFDLNDLELRENYTWWKAIGVLNAYNDIMVQEFAHREPNMTFIHIFPGAVRTNIFESNRWYLRPFLPIVYLLARLWMTSQEDCAEYMWYGMLASEAGAYLLGEKGEKLAPEKLANYGGPIVNEKLWEHSLQITKVTTE